MIKIAIIGASYLQLPLIRKAKDRGMQTHVFAWAANDAGEQEADFFYPISITKKDEILKKCREIGISGICSIASDLAMAAVNYVAAEMGLVGNSMSCMLASTNKYKMRERFQQMGDPSVRYMLVKDNNEWKDIDLSLPVIVKPVDRSGSRGVTKVSRMDGLEPAVYGAFEQGFKREALIEEYIEGDEYSIETISWKGEHNILAVTKKYTTNSPSFIEVAHMEPAQMDVRLTERVKSIVVHALNSLEIQYGASHTEIKITKDNDVKIVEIGGRMGGDCIGSDLVCLSTGVDFVDAVLDVAIGICPVCEKKYDRAAAVRYIFNRDDMAVAEKVKKEHPEYVIREEIQEIDGRTISDSSNRYGYILLCAEMTDQLIPYMPYEL